MDAIFQPGACWLVIAENGCTVVRIQPGGDKCHFPGENGAHSLDRVQEWLSPVWTATMLRCVQCLKRVAQQLQPGTQVDICDDCRSAAGAPQPASYWIAYLNGQPDILQVVENGIRLLGQREVHPLTEVREWLMPIWGPDMAYCPGCSQAKAKRDIVFFFRKSPKGVCKDCTEHFDLDALPKKNRV